jgi:hypothetical protein
MKPFFSWRRAKGIRSGVSGVPADRWHDSEKDRVSLEPSDPQQYLTRKGIFGLQEHSTDLPIWLVHFTQNPSSSLYESRISRCAGPLWL